MTDSVGFPIGYVSMATGLTTHVLRAWERRYRAVTPARSESGRRLYTESDIERLHLLKRVVGAGHSIGNVAGLDKTMLKRLAPAREAPSSKAGGDGRYPDVSAEDAPHLIELCLQAIAALNTSQLCRFLQKASLAFSRQSLIEKVLKPVMNEVGRRWAEGSLRVMHEHMASCVFQALFNRMLDNHPPTEVDTPRILIATPAGQHCHLGAMAIAVTAQDHCWEPIFLGPNLPAEEIGAAYATLKPQAVALSITCRTNDAFMHAEIHRLAVLLADRCALVFGGQASPRYRSSVESAGGTLCSTTEAFVDLLN